MIKCVKNYMLADCTSFKMEILARTKKVLSPFLISLLGSSFFKACSRTVPYPFAALPVAVLTE